LWAVSTRPQPRFDAPRSEAAKQLAALVKVRHDLGGQEAAINQQEREAHDNARRLAAELTDLERRVAVGEQVSAQARTKAEQTLVKARIAAHEPWAERRAGVQAAIRDQEHAILQFVAENLDELVAEIEEDGQDAAQALNRACRAVEDAYLQRMACEQRLTSVVGMVRIPRPGEIAFTRAEEVRRAAVALLMAGGEQPPTLKVDPREPRHSTASVEPLGESEADVESLA
jgi:hypothetical protein